MFAAGDKMSVWRENRVSWRDNFLSMRQNYARQCEIILH